MSVLHLRHSRIEHITAVQKFIIHGRHIEPGLRFLRVLSVHRIELGEEIHIIPHLSGGIISSVLLHHALQGYFALIRDIICIQTDKIPAVHHIRLIPLPFQARIISAGDYTEGIAVHIHLLYGIRQVIQ